MPDFCDMNYVNARKFLIVIHFYYWICFKFTGQISQNISSLLHRITLLFWMMRITDWNIWKSRMNNTW
jgi:hypothetical protein